MVTGIFIVVGIVSPFLIPPSIIIVIIFFKMRNMYLSTARNMQRLVGIGEYRVMKSMGLQ